MVNVHLLLILLLSCHLLQSSVCYALLSRSRSIGPKYMSISTFDTKRNMYERHDNIFKFSRISKLAQSSNDIQAGAEDENKSIVTRLLGGFSSSVRKNFLWSKYSSSLFVRPVATKSVSSLMGFMLGDVLAQFFFRKGYGSTAFNLARCVRMGMFGALVHAPLGHMFYGQLERRLPGSAPTTVVAKVVIDQLLWAPTFASCLLSFIGVTAGASPNQIALSISQLISHVILASWAIWPLTHYVSFRFVPASNRLLFINAAQVLFNTAITEKTKKFHEERQRGEDIEFTE